jgi:NAD(P)-dependent dehydrogenase (short-subunit alcohol dehydrogenase family)
MGLHGKVIVVTGSTRGIGRAIAQACASEGARIVLCSRDEGAVKRATDDFLRQGYEATGIAVDVSRQQDLERLLQHAIDTWGRVDVWVNNAGLSAGYLPLDEMSPEEIAEVVDVNLTGTLRACRIAILHFIEQGGGILINLSGKGGRGDASPFTTVYAATKAAVTSLTKSLALEYKDHPISIHSILPSMVATELTTDVKTSPKLSDATKTMPYVMKAIGVPVDVVGSFVAQIAAQEPGKATGKSYSVLKGKRLARGIALLTWYRLTGKIKSEA